MTTQDDAADLLEELRTCQIERREIERQLREQETQNCSDELLLRRLERRRVALRSRIETLSHLLDPDILA